MNYNPNELHKTIQFYKYNHRNMPAYSPVRRSTRHVGKVINYNKQAELIDAQIKQAVSTDKRKYREDWKKKEKVFDDYIRSLTQPEPEPVTPEEKPFVMPKWEDQYESMEAFRDDVVKAIEIDEDNAKIIEDNLTKAKEIPTFMGLYMGYVAYFTKHAVLQDVEDKVYLEREWKRREQEEKDKAHWTQERKDKLAVKMNKLIEEDFGVADIVLRIVENTSKVDTSVDPSIDDFPFVTLYKLNEYIVYLTRKKQTERRKRRRKGV